MFRRSRPSNRRQSVHERYWKRRIAYSIVDMKPLAPPLPLNPLEVLELLELLIPSPPFAVWDRLVPIELDTTRALY
jgi:hypothetical protein